MKSRGSQARAGHAARALQLVFTQQPAAVAAGVAVTAKQLVDVAGQSRRRCEQLSSGGHAIDSEDWMHRRGRAQAAVVAPPAKRANRLAKRVRDAAAGEVANRMFQRDPGLWNAADVEFQDAHNDLRVQ